MRRKKKYAANGAGSGSSRSGKNGGTFAKKPNLRKKNGHGGKRPGSGRPPKRFVNDPETVQGQRDSARARGANRLDDVVRGWELIVEMGVKYLEAGKLLPERLESLYMRASENLANRCGLPILSETSVRGAVPVKLINDGQGPGWKDDQGNFHPIEPAGTEDKPE